ncbi:chitotriosidase-1-like [Amblyomma americanum]
MADNDGEDEKLAEDERRRILSRRQEEAPLVCFVRAVGFERTGTRRFKAGAVPADKCTHVVYSYLETDNKTGEFVFHKRGHKDEKDIIRELVNLKHDNRRLKVLFSYGGGAHVKSLLKCLRNDKDEKHLVDTIFSWINSLGLDGVNFHLERPGPFISVEKDVEKILQFIKESCLGRWSDAGVPRYKMVPGIATYGRSFTLTDPMYNGVSAKLNPKHPLGHAGNLTRTEGYLYYVETCRGAGYMGWKREWVKYAATPYIYHKDQWVSYDDKDSTDVKS